MNLNVSPKVVEYVIFDPHRRESTTMKYAPLLREFIAQAHSESLKTAKYALQESGVQVKASFGQGAKARVPWISFTKEGHTTANGIYPVYLYFKSQQLLILAFGISETTTPMISWDRSRTTKIVSISVYFEEKGYSKPERYGSSYVYKVYDPNNLPSNKVLDTDLNAIIEIYHQTTGLGIIPKRIEKENHMEKLFEATIFEKALQQANLIFSNQLVTRYIASLMTKPFLILTGLSGSGKTQLAKGFAQWISKDAEQYCIVPVGADWTNRDPLLGYPNGLKNNEYILPETGALQLVMRAIDYPDLPHFLILDEMNLSHVERYFADFLSVMESRDAILLHDLNIKEIPKKITLPENLFIIGTVNIDETTYMFSPKVLDRANVIEFRVEKADMMQFLKEPVRPSEVANSGSNMGRDFVLRAREEVIAQTDEVLMNVMKFFEQLQLAGAEFGYRTAIEINRLMYYLNELGVRDDEERLDVAIMQKLLPKLHGSRRKLLPIIERMAEGCVDSGSHSLIKEYLDSGKFDEAVLQPLTMGKLHRMYRSAIDNGFASYAEA